MKNPIEAFRAQRAAWDLYYSACARQGVRHPDAEALRLAWRLLWAEYIEISRAASSSFKMKCARLAKASRV